MNAEANSLRVFTNEERARISIKVLLQCPRELQLLLKTATDEKDREIFALTDKHTKEAINSVIFFCGRYDINWTEKPIHISETCILTRAVDYKASLQYAATFDGLAPAETEYITMDQLCTCMEALGGVYGRLDAGKRKLLLQTDLKKVFKTRGDKNRLSRCEFIQFCCAMLGETKPVVVKFMMHKVRSYAHYPIRQC